MLTAHSGHFGSYLWLDYVGCNHVTNYTLVEPLEIPANTQYSASMKNGCLIAKGTVPLLPQGVVFTTGESGWPLGVGISEPKLHFLLSYRVGRLANM